MNYFLYGLPNNSSLSPPLFLRNGHIEMFLLHSQMFIRTFTAGFEIKDSMKWLEECSVFPVKQEVITLLAFR